MRFLPRRGELLFFAAFLLGAALVHAEEGHWSTAAYDAIIAVIIAAIGLGREADDERV